MYYGKWLPEELEKDRLGDLPSSKGEGREEGRVQALQTVVWV